MTEVLAAPPVPAPAKSPPARPSRAKRVLRRCWRFTVAVFAIIGFLTVVRPFVFDFTPMVSGSMSPTLQGDEHSGDWVVAEKLSYLFREPRRGEIVEFRDAEGTQIMKRVIGLPGERVSIKEERAQVNGREIDRPSGAAAVPYYASGNLARGRSQEVGNGYYVLGDNSADSNDSRYVGSIPRERIRARAWFIVWPPHRMGWVR